MKERLQRTLSSLSIRNYRLYFLGQLASVSGTWMQQIAMAWLVLRLTNSALDLGIMTALLATPYLLFGVWSGLIVDRLDKRRLLLWTQSVQAALAVVFWALAASGAIDIWMIYGLVLARGTVNTFDNPARQSFVSEMVGREQIVNAVSLNASLTQASRLFGPAIAAVVIATLGLSNCFLLNALSYAGMIGALILMDKAELFPGPVAKRAKRQLRDGLAVIARTPELRLPLLLMTFVGLLSFNFNVLLPLVARYTFHGSASTYAAMTSVMAVGALGGALSTGLRTVVNAKLVSVAAITFGIGLGLAAVAPDLPLMLVALVIVGATSVTFSALVQSTLQINVVPEMRGRVLSLYQVVYQGSTPVGALIVAGLATADGPRAGLWLGSVAALLAGIVGVWFAMRLRRPIGNEPSAPISLSA